MSGYEGKLISAGITWAFRENMKYGIVAEVMDEKPLQETLEWKIWETAKIRGLKIA